MKKILEIHPHINISENICIVGSSSSLLENNNGGLIDSFDDVVRFNRAPVLQEYKECVGEKTTIRVCNPHVFACRPFTGRWTLALGSQPTFFIREQEDCAIISIGPENAEIAFKKHKDLVHNTCSSHKLNFNSIISSPTIGFAFVNLLISYGIVPHVFGFSGMPGSKKGLTHYWEKRDNISICHNYPIERKIFDEWNRASKIKLYT